MASTSPRAGVDLALAEGALRRRGGYGLRFRSVKNALGFFFEKGPLLASPGGVRWERDCIDGGPPADRHEVLAVVQTIRQAIDALGRVDPAAARALALHHGEGLPLRKVAPRLNVSVATASMLVGKGESFVLGWLQGDVIPL